MARCYINIHPDTEAYIHRAPAFVFIFTYKEDCISVIDI